MTEFKPIKDVGGFGKLGGIKPLKRRTPPVEPPTPSSGVVELLSAEERTLLRMVGNDKRLMKRLQKLMVHHPTSPPGELITYDWLAQENIPFYYQVPFFGGRPKRGGIVLDFLVPYGGRGLAWRVQNMYWSSKPDANEDVAEEIRLLGQVHHGVKIEVVVDLWDSAIQNKRPQVFDLALAGVEMGR